MSTLWNPVQRPLALARSIASNGLGSGGAPKGGGENCARISATDMAPPSSRSNRSFAHRRMRRCPSFAADSRSEPRRASASAEPGPGAERERRRRPRRETRLSRGATSTASEGDDAPGGSAPSSAAPSAARVSSRESRARERP